MKPSKSIDSKPCFALRRFGGVGAGLAGVVLSTLLLGCAGEPSKRPDIVVITLDTVRADHLGFYGYSRPTTPFLDHLATESTVFERAIAQAAVTPVSHASIFTGLDPYHHGLRVLHGLVGNRLDESQTTMAEVLAAEGWKTAAFISAFPAGRAFGLEQGFDHFDDTLPHADGSEVVDEDGTVNTGPSQRPADQTVDAALSWLATLGEAEEPLFLWLHFFDPHDLRFLPPRDLVDLFPPAFEVREEVLRSIYDAEIRFVDGQIERFFQAFRERRSWDDTVVAVLADHGEGLGDHGWWSHGILYQEQIRVPLLVRAPGRSAHRVQDLVRTIDLMPTVLELAGVESRPAIDMDGMSLVPAMETGLLGEDRTAYADSVNLLDYTRRDQPDRKDEKDDKLYSLQRGDLKLIYHQLQPENSELYDLGSDPGERHDLAAERPDVLREMIAELKSRGALSDLMPGMTPTDPEHAERLRSLGYIQ